MIIKKRCIQKCLSNQISFQIIFNQVLQAKAEFKFVTEKYNNLWDRNKNQREREREIIRISWDLWILI